MATIGTPRKFLTNNHSKGVDFKVKFLDINTGDNHQQQRLKLTIWDTAGQERFRTLTSSYYRGAQGVILVYDVCNRTTFENLQGTWITELSNYASMDQLVLMVVGNKIDKVSIVCEPNVHCMCRTRRGSSRLPRVSSWHGP